MKISRKAFLRSLSGMAGAGLFRINMRAADTAMGPMRIKNLGKTGLKVTALGLGATRTMEPALVRAALDRGIRFIDTGRSYFNGKNEEMLGQVLAGRRNEVVIQSKVKLPKGDSPGAALLQGLERDLDLTLKALQTDRVDVMLLHGIEEETVLDDDRLKEFFLRAKKAGKILACGFSAHRNHLALLEKTLRVGFFEIVMLPFTPFGGFRHSIGGWSTSWDQDGLIRTLERAHAAGIGIVAMKTCSGGPFAHRQGDQPSLAGAVSWVTEKPYIHTAAVAIANFQQLAEHAGE